MTEPDRGEGEPSRRAVRLLWASFVGVLAVLGLLTPLVAPDAGSTVPAALPVTLAAAFGTAGLVAIVAVDRGLTEHPPPDDRAAVAALRSRLVVQAAIAEVPALLAVAMAVALGPGWTATAGALPGLIGLVLVRPSDDRLDRLDAAWRAAGADVSLRRVLT